MNKDELKRIIEALLFVSDKPLSAESICEIVKKAKPSDIKILTDELNSEYASSGRSFNIKEIAGGFQMLTDPVFSKYIAALYKRGQDKLSAPALETLAIIAYKQPLTRSDIEIIRGVNVDGVLRTLEDRNLIKTKGRLDAPGRPILYVTTMEFLQHFGLRSLDELPNLKEFQETDLDFVKEFNKANLIEAKSDQEGISEAVSKSSGEASFDNPAPLQETQPSDVKA